MNNNIKGIKKNNGKVDTNTKKIAIRVKDVFPKDASGVEYIEVSYEAYKDICEYRALMDSALSQKTETSVEINVKKYYPHFCGKRKLINITEEMYVRQLEHVRTRKAVLAKPREFEKEYRDVPTFMEITVELLDEMSKNRNADEAYEKRQERTYDGLGFEEESRGDLNGIFTESNADRIDLELIVRRLFQPYGEILTRRAVMYLCEGQKTSMIARAEMVSNHSAWESVEKIREIVRDAGKEYFGLD